MDPDSYHYFSVFLLESSAFLTASFWFAILLIVLLLFFQAMIAASEVAFFSIRPNELTEGDLENEPSVRRIIKLLNNPRLLLSTLLVASNFISIGIVVTSSFVLETVFEHFHLQSLGIDDQYAGVIRGVIEVGIVTFLLVLFGEVAPKLFASSNSLATARAMSGVMIFLRRLLRPISILLVNTTSYIEKRFEKNGNHGFLSMDDLDSAIDLTVASEKESSDQEVDILKGIIKFGQINVTQIMTPRVDIHAVDKEMPYRDLLKYLKESGYSRIPVYEDNLDHIIGTLHSKDLLQYLDKDAFDWNSVIRTAYFVPENKKIDDLLKEFQRKRVHLAIVVDEYGGTVGLISLEDIMEEIIGDIRDEFDDPESIEFTKIDEFNYLFPGKTLLHDVLRVLKMEPDVFEDIKGNADTIAGLILEINGTFPKLKSTVKYNNMTFTVMKMSRRRIEEVKVTIAAIS